MSYGVICQHDGEPPVIVGNIQRKDAAETLAQVMNFLSAQVGETYIYSVCPLPKLTKREGVAILEQQFSEDQEMIPIVALSTDLRKNKIVKQFLEAHNNESSV